MLIFFSRRFISVDNFVTMEPSFEIISSEFSPSIWLRSSGFFDFFVGFTEGTTTTFPFFSIFGGRFKRLFGTGDLYAERRDFPADRIEGGTEEDIERQVWRNLNRRPPKLLTFSRLFTSTPFPSSIAFATFLLVSAHTSSWAVNFWSLFSATRFTSKEPNWLQIEFQSEWGISRTVRTWEQVDTRRGGAEGISIICVTSRREDLKSREVNLELYRSRMEGEIWDRVWL
mmetsp:Transcript_28612/g.54052  ORF Transcript_28612/g.54052 Transcript_28612/m.54052 type:complete len:228 (-) Transcript_28612:1645-2328(-)